MILVAAYGTTNGVASAREPWEVGDQVDSPANYCSLVKCESQIQAQVLNCNHTAKVPEDCLAAQPPLAFEGENASANSEAVQDIPQTALQAECYDLDGANTCYAQAEANSNVPAEVSPSIPLDSPPADDATAAASTVDAKPEESTPPPTDLTAGSTPAPTTPKTSSTTSAKVDSDSSDAGTPGTTELGLGDSSSDLGVTDSTLPTVGDAISQAGSSAHDGGSAPVSTPAVDPALTLLQGAPSASGTEDSGISANDVALLGDESLQSSFTSEPSVQTVGNDTPDPIKNLRTHISIASATSNSVNGMVLQSSEPLPVASLDDSGAVSTNALGVATDSRDSRATAVMEMSSVVYIEISTTVSDTSPLSYESVALAEGNSGSCFGSSIDPNTGEVSGRSC